jgi:hypothetical protein
MSNKKNQRGAVSKQRLMQLIISGTVLCLVTALANAAVQSGVYIWFVAYSNLTAVLQPQLAITPSGTDSVQLSWATNFTDYALEYVTALPSAGWSLDNAVSNTGDQLSVTIRSEALQRFYRLHKP